MNKDKLPLPGLAIGLFLVALAAEAQVSTATTDPVRGRPPVVSSVVINNQSAPSNAPKMGDLLEVGKVFTDADSDLESGTSFQWLRAGLAIPGATASTYATVAADANRSLAVVVTPRTDPAKTDPFSGAPGTSPLVVVAAHDIGNFLGPSLVARSWPDANSHCQSLGTRLPTHNELQQLFVDATSSPAFYPNAGHVRNHELCDMHGWPLGGQCGGGPYYWSSTPYDASHHYSVTLDVGSAGPSPSVNVAQVACIR